MAPNSWNLFKAPRYRGFTIRQSLLKGVCKQGRVEVSLSMNNCIKRRVYRGGKVFNLDNGDAMEVYARVNYIERNQFLFLNFVCVYQSFWQIFALQKIPSTARNNSHRQFR